MKNLGRITWGALLVILYLNISSPPSFAAIRTFEVTADVNDGTEVIGAGWYPNGPSEDDRNIIGYDEHGRRCALKLKFDLSKSNPGSRVKFARLVMPSQLSEPGQGLNLEVRLGEKDTLPPAFLNSRSGSKGPVVSWNLTKAWDLKDARRSPRPPFPYQCISPDLSVLVNRILSYSSKGSDNITFIIYPLEESGKGRVVLFDFRQPFHFRPQLELYETAYDTLVGKELLGRIEDDRVTVSFWPLAKSEIYLEYGTKRGIYNWAKGEMQISLPGKVKPVPAKGGEAVRIILDGLKPNTRYYYRTRCRMAGEKSFETGPERTFITQRPPGSTYVCTLTFDEHLQNQIYFNNQMVMERYRRVLKNVANDRPDFHISLGDFANTELYAAREVINEEEAIMRYLDQRTYLEEVVPSAPFFLAIGNHEGEEGWELDGTPNNMAVRSTRARKATLLNPVPDRFYNGDATEYPFVGKRETIYSWTWGDALFVVIDPYWFTVRSPHGRFRKEGQPEGSKDNWDWTLGKEQYDWLYKVLSESKARWKFVMSHQITGGNTTYEDFPYYGRGGAEWAKYKVSKNPTFEWGGEDRQGRNVWSEKRPGWNHGPIHDMMVETGVTVFFRGHDHYYLDEKLDGIHYILGPIGHSGHIRLTVSPEKVRIEHVDEEQNGKVTHSLEIPDK